MQHPCDPQQPPEQAIAEAFRQLEAAHLQKIEDLETYYLLDLYLQRDQSGPSPFLSGYPLLELWGGKKAARRLKNPPSCTPLCVPVTVCSLKLSAIIFTNVR